MSNDLLARADVFMRNMGAPEFAYERMIVDLADALREARAERDAWKEKYGDANVWGLQNAARWKEHAERAEVERDEARAGWKQECDDADAILTSIGLDPAQCRTDGGWLNVPKIRALRGEEGRS